MAIPFYVTLAREQAATFRIKMESLATDFSGNWPDQAWDRIDAVLQPRHDADRGWGYSPPVEVLSVVHEALGWAYDPSSKPDDIRSARSELEAILSERIAAWKVWDQIRTRAPQASSRASWLRQVIAAATAQYDLARSALAAQWPLTEGDDDRATPEELEAGGGIGMDDAFALIAGVTSDEWRRMVAVHPRKVEPRGVG